MEREEASGTARETDHEIDDDVLEDERENDNVSITCILLLNVELTKITNRAAEKGRSASMLEMAIAPGR